MCKISPHHYNDNLDNFSILFMTSEITVIEKVVNTRKNKTQNIPYLLSLQLHCAISRPNQR